MQIRKCLLAVGFAVAALSVQAADSDAQVKAREALQQKLKTIDSAAVTNAPAPAEPVPPAAAAATTTPAEQPTPPQPPAATPAPATPQINGVPTPADPAVIEKARESMRKKMDELIAAQLAADEAAKQAPPRPPDKPFPPQEPKAPKQPTSLPPIDPPPLPISAEKKQQLDALLTRYKADQVTPDQYQTERAKILQGD